MRWHPSSATRIRHIFKDRNIVARWIYLTEFPFIVFVSVQAISCDFHGPWVQPICKRALHRKTTSKRECTLRAFLTDGSNMLLYFVGGKEGPWSTCLVAIVGHIRWWDVD